MKKFLTLAFTCVAALSVAVAEDDKAGKDKKGKGKGDPAARAAAMLKKLDTDESGTVSEAEFLAGPFAKKMTEAGKDPKKVFAAKDKDKSGDLDAKELAARGGKGKGKGKGKGGDKKPKPEGDS